MLKFKGRQRNVWGRYYTELFFLDEVTAFAAGHRPCFECRRQDAERFAVLFSGKKQRASADAMDSVLHAERLDGKAKPAYRRSLDSLPDGAMVALDGEVFAVRDKHLLPWTPSGYSASKPRPRNLEVDVLRRHRSSPYSDGATRHCGIRAQAKVVRSAGCWSQPGRDAPRRKTRWQT